jgi:hypothetical protein
VEKEWEEWKEMRDKGGVERNERQRGQEEWVGE